MMLWSDHEVATCRPGFGGRPMLGDRLRLWRRKNLLVIGGVIQRAKPAVAPVSYIVPKHLARSCNGVLFGRGTEEGWKVIAPSPEDAAALVAEMWCRIPDEEDGA